MTRAFRILAAVFGVLTIVPSLYFAVLSLVSSDPVEHSHRVHTIGGLWGFGLTGAVLIAIAVRPSNVNAFQAGFAASVGMLVVGLVAGDLVTGLLFVGLVATAILLWLHPLRREALSFSGRPSLVMVGVGILALFPAGAYALTMAALQDGPPNDPHVELHHWSGMAAGTLSIVLVGIVAGLRTSGWRLIAGLTVAAGLLLGLTWLVYPDLPGSVDTPWGWLAIAAALLYGGAALLAAREGVDRRVLEGAGP